MGRHWSRREFCSAAAGIVGAAAVGLRERTARADADQPGRPRLGMQSYTLRSIHDPVKVIDTCQELGMAHIEFFEAHLSSGTPRPKVAEMHQKMKAAGLRLSADYLGGLSKDHEANRKIFQFAKRAGIPQITGDPAEDSFDSLDKLVAEFDIRIAIHNHGPGARYDKIADVLKAIKGHDPRIGACADLGHYIRSAEDPVKAIVLFNDRLYGIHLKDFAEQKADARGVILGKGHLDVLGVYKALMKVNFPANGALSLEYEEHESDPLPDVKECIAVAREAQAKAWA